MGFDSLSSGSGTVPSLLASADLLSEGERHTVHHAILSVGLNTLLVCNYFSALET